jgi:hypothetical protein
MTRKLHRQSRSMPSPEGPTLLAAKPSPAPAATRDRAVVRPEDDPDESIRTRAYYKWVEAGCPPGDGVQFWLDAESETRPAVS